MIKLINIMSYINFLDKRDTYQLMINYIEDIIYELHENNTKLALLLNQLT